MKHRIKFLFLVLLLVLPLLFGTACSLTSNSSQRPPSGYDIKNVVGDALQIGDVLDEAVQHATGH